MSNPESGTFFTFILLVSGCVLPGLWGYCEMKPRKNKPCTNNESVFLVVHINTPRFPNTLYILYTLWGYPYSNGFVYLDISQPQGSCWSHRWTKTILLFKKDWFDLFTGLIIFCVCIFISFTGVYYDLRVRRHLFFVYLSKMSFSTGLTPRRL